MALEEFLTGWRVWPTWDEFVAGGAKELREAITQMHGAAWWARDMNLPGGDRQQGGVRRWTDERIRATLSSFLNGRTTWPTNREFDEAGLRAFREALRHYGGPRRWSAEMGVAWTPTARSPSGPPPRRYVRKPPGSKPDHRRWTDETITEELERFLGRRSVWPRYVDFAQADKIGLYHAVKRYGGAQMWAERMGVSWVERYGRSDERWSADRVREALSELLVDRETWPTRAEFAAAGALQLWRAVRRGGGERRWADELGVSLPSDPGVEPDRPRLRLRRRAGRVSIGDGDPASSLGHAWELAYDRFEELDSGASCDMLAEVRWSPDERA